MPKERQKSRQAIRDKLIKKQILFDESPCCRKCGVVTTMDSTLTQTINGQTVDNCTTIQHNLPRTHPNYHNDYTLWCYKCNQEDAVNKQTNRIFSREELIHYLRGGKVSLNGRFVVDGIMYRYQEHKLAETKDFIEFKFEKLKEYMYHLIDGTFNTQGQTKPTFEKYLKIKGVYSFAKYYIGEGWYHYKVETGITLTDIEKRMPEIKTANAYVNIKSIFNGSRV